MKITYFLVALLVLFALTPTEMWAGINVWTSSGPLRSIGALAVDPQNPQTVYAGDAEAGGVFKTTDGGRSWTRFASMGSDVSILVVDPQNQDIVYAGTRNGGGLFKITNHQSQNCLRGVAVLGLAIDPQNSNTIYVAGGAGAGIFRSIDGCETWIRSGFGFFTNREILDLQIDPQTPSTMYAADHTGLFKSIDGGANWRLVKSGPTSNGIFLPRIVIDPHNPNRLYAVTSESNSGRTRVFQSIDGGDVWDPVDLRPPADIHALAIGADSASTLYASTSLGGVLRTTDNAGSWTAINLGLANSIFALALDPKNTGTLYAGTSGNGFFKSTDGAESWVRLPRPRFVNRLAIDPQTPGTVYAATIDGVFKSTDGGATGTKPFRTGTLGTLPLSAFVIDPQNPLTLYAGLNTYSRDNGPSGIVFKTIDGGVSWDELSLPENFGFGMLALDPQNPSIVYVAANIGSGDYRLFKSIDGGLSWSLPPSDLKAKGNTWGAFIIALAIDPQNSDTIYAAADQYNDEIVLSKTTDGGKTWADLGFHGVNAIAIDPLNSRTVYAGTNNGVFKSIDAGATWTALNSGLPVNSIGFHPSIQFLAIDPQNSANIYATSSDGGVFAITVVP